MKKHLSIGFAIAFAAAILTNTTQAASDSTLDELSYNPASPSIERNLQNSYLDALRLRYKNMYNRMTHGRNYYNSFVQQDRLSQLKKENHIEGNLGSEMNRSGEMEQDKDRVRTVDKNRVQAVNSKQTFRKAAINYYVDGGDGYTSAEAMEMGNVDGMKNEVPRRKMLDEMYKANVGATVLSTRDMIRNMGVRMGNKSVKKPSTYYKGRFHDRMLSPYMSTRWMD